MSMKFEHEVDDKTISKIKELTDGTQYQVTDRGWVKIREREPT